MCPHYRPDAHQTDRVTVHALVDHSADSTPDRSPGRSTGNASTFTHHFLMKERVSTRIGWNARSVPVNQIVTIRSRHRTSRPIRTPGPPAPRAGGAPQ